MAQAIFFAGPFGLHKPNMSDQVPGDLNHAAEDDVYAGEGESITMPSRQQVPTRDLYPEFEMAYEHFNAALFEGKLPAVLITLQRKNRTEGYWAANRFAAKNGERAGELAINPRYLAVRSVEEILSVLVHEQTHVWQSYHGKPGRRGYHNREWAEKMKSIGLYPSSTDQVGGDETGEKMGHYIVEDGPFTKAAKVLIEEKGFGISWYDRFPEHKVTPIARSASSNREEVTGFPAPLAATNGDAIEPVEASNAAQADANGAESAHPSEPKTGSEQMGTQVRPIQGVSVSQLLNSASGAEVATPARQFPQLGLQLANTDTPRSQTRFKFICPVCKQAAWGKASLDISCTPCGGRLAKESKVNES